MVVTPGRAANVDRSSKTRLRERRDCREVLCWNESMFGARRFLLVAAALVAVAFASAPANAASVVNGSIQPSSLRGGSTVVMFFHPF